MDKTLLMSRFEGFRNLLANIERVFYGYGTVLQVVIGRLALDVFHDKEPSPFQVVEPVYHRYVRRPNRLARSPGLGRLPARATWRFSSV